MSEVTEFNFQKPIPIGGTWEITKAVVTTTSRIVLLSLTGDGKAFETEGVRIDLDKGIFLDPVPKGVERRATQKVVGAITEEIQSRSLR